MKGTKDSVHKTIRFPGGFEPARRRRTWAEMWRRVNDVRTTAQPLLSFTIPTAFAVYNGFLGATHASLWHGSICVYYLLLAVIRGVILLAERRARGLKPGKEARLEYRAFLVSSVALLALNLALVTPIALMVKLQKPVNMGLIPAIAVAAYTTYKVTAASIHYGKRRKSRGLLPQETRSINFIDALVSVVTLQNTLIMVNLGKEGGDMLALTAVSSALFLAAIIAVSVANLAHGIKRIRRTTP